MLNEYVDLKIRRNYAYSTPWILWHGKVRNVHAVILSKKKIYSGEKARFFFHFADGSENTAIKVLDLLFFFS